MAELNLSDEERAEVKALIDAGQPLPDNYRFRLFAEPREAELIWPGKTSEVTNVVLPFQSIEQIDEPRAESGAQVGDLFSMGAGGRQESGWHNKLIWGDNKLVLSSLKGGPLRREIERAGGLKLVYIDPPFDVGADFSFEVEVGGDAVVERNATVIEEIAYRDTWGRGTDSYIHMLYERMAIISGLMHPEGSIYVHLGPNISHLVKTALDEIFGDANFRSEIVWRRSNSHNKTTDQYGPIHDVILFYTKSENFVFHPGQRPFSRGYIESRFKYKDKHGIYQPNYLTGPGTRTGDSGQPWRGFNPTKVGRHWAIPSRLIPLLPVGIEGKTTQQILDILLDNELLVIPKKEGGQPMYRQYLTEGVPYQDIWAYQPNTAGTLYGTEENIDADVKWLEQEQEKVAYSTQKPEGLLNRILVTSSDPGDLVMDFFCGSGTTLAVAEKLGRKWIGCDLGRFAIHTSRKRLIGVQRELKKAGKPYRAFEILNLGKYERQWFVGIDPTLPEDQRVAAARDKEARYLALILEAYKAEPLEQSPPFHGAKDGALVHVGPVDAPVTESAVADTVAAARAMNSGKVDLLGFEFEMGIAPRLVDEARAKGVAVALRYIPKEVFDRRAVDKGQVSFHDLAYVEAKAEVVSKRERTVTVSLTNFAVSYRQDDVDSLIEGMRPGTRVTVDGGQVVKLVKGKDGSVERTVLTEEWTDWIDYWAVDFDYLSRPEKEVVTTQRSDGTSVDVEQWTNRYIFENEWQSFRTRKNRALELTSIAHAYDSPGRKAIAVRVIDIFGNDTTKVIGVEV